ncbi:MAG: riboflavin synthase [Solirubrobacteraceae bacterium]|jgi:riboflavin synthase
MFTGLVGALGTVVRVDREAGDGAQIEIEAADIAGELALGDSIAVNGTCLTVSELDGPRFRADVVGETLRRTTLGELGAGAAVNLELALRASDRLGGHIVLGHVDGVGEAQELRDSGELDVLIDAELARYVVAKGSIALDGVSLTVAALDGPLLTVALIPQTREATTFGSVAAGSRLNVEVDVLAKHVEKLVCA